MVFAIRTLLEFSSLDQNISFHQSDQFLQLQNEPMVTVRVCASAPGSSMCNYS